MRKITAFVLGLMLMPILVSAQWQRESVFPDTTTNKKYSFNSTHGIGVDATGKVYVLDYYPKFTIDFTLKSTTGADSVVSKKAGGVFVFNPDGSLADSIVSFNGEFIGAQALAIENSQQTKYDYLTGRGMRYDAVNNHMLVVMMNRLYRIDCATGKVINKFEPNLSQGSKAAPAIDAAGNVYIGPVAAGGGTITKFSYDKAANTYGAGEDLVTLTGSFSRSFEVSPDGNTIFWAGYTTGAVLKYHRASEFDTFGAPDTVLKGMKPESFSYNPGNGKLYISSGSTNDVPAEPWSLQAWYEFDPAAITKEGATPSDSIVWVPSKGAFDEARPRALAFTADGKTAYAGMFSSPVFYSVQKFKTSTLTSVEKEVKSLDGFTLSQNYPNPFNPSTRITFTMGKSGFATLKVFDVLGREVASLVNSNLNVGEHTVNFDASRLASGTYIYMLQSGNVRLTNKLTLVK